MGPTTMVWAWYEGDGMAMDGGQCSGNSSLGYCIVSRTSTRYDRIYNRKASMGQAPPQDPHATMAMRKSIVHLLQGIQNSPQNTIWANQILYMNCPHKYF